MIDEGMSSLKMNTAERQTAIRNLLSQTDVSTKEADTAFLIELVGGVFGLFGLGHLYAGLTNTGIFRLVLGFVALGALYFVLGITFIGLCAYPLVWIGQIAIAYFTATDLKQSINAVKAGGGGMSAMSTPGGYIESPTSMSSDIFGSPVTPSQPATPPSSEISFSTPPPAAPMSSSESLFSNPTPPSQPATPSTPEITFTSPPAAAPANDGDEEDFNPDDLTKKV